MTNRRSHGSTMRRPPASAGMPFIVVLDASSKEPLFRQLHQAIRTAILSGNLKPGAKLPSTRALAAELLIGRNTASLAYDYLQAEGFLTTGIGSGTYVSRDLHITHSLRQPSAASTNSREAPLSRLAQSVAQNRSVPPLRSGAPRPFRLGEPALDMFPTESWSRLLRRHARRAGAELLAYGDVQGYRHLRNAVLPSTSARHAAYEPKLIRCSSCAVRNGRPELKRSFPQDGGRRAADALTRCYPP